VRNFQKRSGDKRQYVSSQARRRMSKSKEENTNAVGHEVSEQTRELLQEIWNDERHKQMRAAMRAKRPCGICAIRGCLRHVAVKHLVTKKTYYLLLLPASLTREFLNPEECRMRAHRAMHRQIAEHTLKFRVRRH
jgi:hypothetical protein